jgi:hypothetical protein
LNFKSSSRANIHCSSTKQQEAIFLGLYFALLQKNVADASIKKGQCLTQALETKPISLNIQTNTLGICKEVLLSHTNCFERNLTIDATHVDELDKDYLNLVQGGASMLLQIKVLNGRHIVCIVVKHHSIHCERH